MVNNQEITIPWQSRGPDRKISVACLSDLTGTYLYTTGEK